MSRSAEEHELLRAVLFDLDDTLYEQATWLSGAWEAVVAAAKPRGVEHLALRAALHDVCAGGSDRGFIIDRALALVGRSDIAVGPLLGAFRAHAPERLTPYPGTAAALEALHAQVATGLVTDGDPVIQRNKLAALGLESHFDLVVFSDDLGREYRKPNPAPLLTALVQLGVDASACVYVGDRPDKDVVAATAAGMRAVRVRTGEYAHQPDEPRAWATAPDVVSAINGLLRRSGARSR